MDAYIYAWNSTKKVEDVGHTVPITFQTYVNSGFVIFGLHNSKWLDVVPTDIADDDWIEIWNNGENTMVFYILPTSSNYSVILAPI